MEEQNSQADQDNQDIQLYVYGLARCVGGYARADLDGKEEKDTDEQNRWSRQTGYGRVRRGRFGLAGRILTSKTDKYGQVKTDTDK